MGYIIGSGYKGSSALETSVAGVEILPDSPASWTVNYQYYTFNFYNDQECTIKINGDIDNIIYLRAGQGFKGDEKDKPIESFKIIESGITYNWQGNYT